MTASEFLKEVDGLVALAMTDPKSLKPCCTKGCSTCCSEALMASSAEVEYMVEGYPPEKLDALKERSAAWLEKFRPFQYAETRDGLINGFPYLEADIKCPFLEGNLCSAYERRPMSCRVYFAQGNPEHCKMPHRRKQMISDYDFGHPLWTRLWLQLAQSSNELYMDHLGIHLSNILTGATHESSVSVKYQIT